MILIKFYILLCVIALIIGGGMLTTALLVVSKKGDERMPGEKNLVDSLRQLGKYTDLVPNYFLLAADRIEELERPIKTNLDRVRHLSEEEIIEHIYKYDKLLDKICNLKTVCPYGDNPEPENCKDCIRKWLESEVVKQ